MERFLSPVRRCLWIVAATGSAVAGLLPGPAACQLAPDQVNTIRSAIGSRIEALTILGGDFALADGRYTFTGGSTTELDVSRFGGAGDVGDPQKLGDLGIAWQPLLQGNVGLVNATSDIRSGPLKGGTSKFKTFAIEFGMGARFWLSDRLSLAPTLTGMYGHTSNEFAPASASMQPSVTQASQIGLVDWNENTWTIRPALNIQYLIAWDRTLITLSSDPTFFHTQSFSSSNPNDFVNGESASVVDKIDIDIPLAGQLYGHELRTGGFFSRTELFDDVKVGLGTDHLYEAHARLVLDFLNQFWKVQWMGIGGSYLWGPHSSGWTFGADVLFHF